MDIRERTLGVSAAYKIRNLSIGATARYQRFREEALTVRFEFDPRTFRITGFDSFSVQATSDIRTRSDKVKEKHDVTFAGGLKWSPSDRVSVGFAYKQGAKFVVPTFLANADTGFEFVKTADTTFHIPDVYGIGISVRPIPVLTINADAVHVTYSNLVDHFTSINADIRAIDKAYRANDVTEIRLGAEYFFGTKIPVAIRAGAWRDPAHSIEFRGPLRVPDAVAAAILYPKGTGSSHLSVGSGLAWPRFQIDVGYDHSQRFRVGSLSAVARF